jgi:hypothetical protein
VVKFKHFSVFSWMMMVIVFSDDPTFHILNEKEFLTRLIIQFV